MEMSDLTVGASDFLPVIALHSLVGITKLIDHTGLDRSHLRGSCTLHHALINPHSLSLLQV